MPYPQKYEEEKMNMWHGLNCNQITNDNPTCKCMQINHHVGAYIIAKFLGLTKNE